MPHAPGHQTFIPGSQTNPVPPPTGLIGSEQALRQGLASQLGLLSQGIGGAQGEIDIATQQARQDVNSGFNQATGAINPFVRGGGDASEMQAALSGALGDQAQQIAFNTLNNSPGQRFAVEQGEQAIIRNQAALGGLGGGNVRRELNRQGIGMAQQNFQQNFNNLGQVAASGRQAAGLQAGLFGQRGQNLANITQQSGINLSNLDLQSGVLPAQAVNNTGNQLAQGRFATGQQIAQAAGGAGVGQANLQNQLGAGLASQFGQGSTNLANLTSGTGAQSAQLQQSLAAILANIGTGSASQAAQLTNAAGQYSAAGILGQNTAVQNTLSQLLQLVPQGGVTTPPPATNNSISQNGSPIFSTIQ